MAPLQDTRVFPGARSPSGVPQGSWKVDLALPVAPPSPVLPDELRVLRSPAAEKPKKGEGGAKEKGGKKKK